MDDIAPELVDNDSKLAHLISNIGEQPEDDQPRWVKEAKFQIHGLCAQYQPCNCLDSTCVFCASGRNGPPFRQDLCRDCIVSQLSKRLEFIGPAEERRMTLRQLAAKSSTRPK